MRWQSLETFPTLRANQIHIWRAPLVRAEKELIELKSFLNKEEQERAAKFIVERAANSFVVARGFLRKLLSKYLQIPPRDLIFQQNQYGKLYIESSSLQFNLSHSHNLALFIFTINASVGIDLEFIREDYKFSDIVRKFFSQKESAALFSLPKNEQVQAFFNCWTCKEAVIKAKGVGMFRALDDFSVEVSNNKWGKMILEDSSDMLESNAWSLEAINPGDEYSGAFAADLSDYSVDFYQI
jgi:4'-phosphopantetheinyl transferase